MDENVVSLWDLVFSKTQGNSRELSLTAGSRNSVVMGALKSKRDGVCVLNGDRAIFVSNQTPPDFGMKNVEIKHKPRKKGLTEEQKKQIEDLTKNKGKSATEIGEIMGLDGRKISPFRQQIMENAQQTPEQPKERLLHKWTRAEVNRAQKVKGKGLLAFAKKLGVKPAAVYAKRYEHKA